MKSSFKITRRWPVIFRPGRRALVERVVLLLASGVQLVDCALISSEALDVLGDLLNHHFAALDLRVAENGTRGM